MFFEILLPKTKPIAVRIIYRPPNQNNFLQTQNENFAKLDTVKKELYIFGDFSMNLYQNQNHTGCKDNTFLYQQQFLMMSRIISNFAQCLACKDNEISNSYNL